MIQGSHDEYILVSTRGFFGSNARRSSDSNVGTHNRAHKCCGDSSFFFFFKRLFIFNILFLCKLIENLDLDHSSIMFYLLNI